LRVETEEALRPERWYHVVATYDGSRVADGIKVYLDGRPAKLKVNLDDLNQDFRTKEPLRVGAAGGPEGRVHGLLDEVRVYDTSLPAEEAAILAAAETVSEIAALPAEKRTANQARKLRACFLDRHAPEHLRRAHAEVVALRRDRTRLVESFPTTMVMEEMPTPRD